jgi:methionyl-tRNA synthetase
VNRVVSLIHKKTEGNVPDVEVEADVLAQVKASAQKIDDIIEAGGLAGAIREISTLALFGNEFVQNREPWKEGNEHTLASALHVCKALAVLIQPFVPRIADKVLRVLNLDNVTIEEVNTVRGGHPLNELEPLFEKIDIEELVARYEAMKQQTEQTT